MNRKYDVVIIGAGAAGLMAASVLAKQNKKVLLLESSSKIAEKIRISGGGRCNFTNLNASSDNYISNNKYFVTSALARYSQYDFIKLVESYNIKYHEKTLGQLFCDGSAMQIIDMLLAECKKHMVEILINCQVSAVTKSDDFVIESNLGQFLAHSLIIATGGLSIPKIGASDFGYRLAEQFGINVTPTRPGLVPLVAKNDLEVFCRELSGVSLPAIAEFKNIKFRENILFTHKGLSGPAILQISSYATGEIRLNLLPDLDLKTILIAAKSGKLNIVSLLKEFLPRRFVERLMVSDRKIVEHKNLELFDIADLIHNFKFAIKDSEGYAKAEVTLGGIDTSELSSKTMEVHKVPGLYFIGEVVDVTGWLGGYNFQWAWSSAYAAACAVASKNLC